MDHLVRDEPKRKVSHLRGNEGVVNKKTANVKLHFLSTVHNNVLVNHNSVYVPKLSIHDPRV